MSTWKKSKYTVVEPLPLGVGRWTDGFWKEVTTVNSKKTIPHLCHMFESSEISHVVENFRICAGEVEGSFDGTVFGDGDFYKWMEAAICSAAEENNEELFKSLDEYISLIAKAQQPDGYISTKQIIGERENKGISRNQDINDFEVYNFGHLFTTASIHYQVTGKRNFLKVAERAADYLEAMYNEAAEGKGVQTAVCPSHYMGLLELYRATKEERYLNLAKLAVMLRSQVENGTDDNQDRLPLLEHDKIIGHAVRANYLYAGVADLYAETGEKEYLEVLHKVWNNLVNQKIYITGGCGALYNGVSPYGNFFHDQKTHQAYGYEYQLPNITAYNETCASVGLVLWAYRMYRIEPKVEYMDMIERAMLNTNLAAVSFDGIKFFYENMLRREEKLEYELVWPLTRSEYILSYCCPPNLARIIAESFSYAYSYSEDTVWLGMYGEGTAKVKLPNGSEFSINQTTSYPYDGKIAIQFKEVKNETPCKINIRVPGWVESGSISYHGCEKQLTKGDAGSYYTLDITDYNSTCYIEFMMPVRYTVAHEMVEEDTNQVAVERGPLVLCMESADNSLDHLMLRLNAEYKTEYLEIKGRKVLSLQGQAYHMNRANNSETALYQTLKEFTLQDTKVTLIPYFAWDNREYGKMRIWTPFVYC